MFTQIVMANITLTIPNELHKKLKERKEIRWSEVIRQILKENLNQLEIIDRILKKSELNESDVEELSRKVDSRVAERLGLK